MLLLGGGLVKHFYGVVINDLVESVLFVMKPMGWLLGLKLNHGSERLGSVSRNVVAVVVAVS